MFKKMDLKEFWLARRKKYPPISDEAVKFLLAFSTVYLFERGVSSVIYVKNK
jgi:hypothetical protein